MNVLRYLLASLLLILGTALPVKADGDHATAQEAADARDQALVYEDAIDMARAEFQAASQRNYLYFGSSYWFGSITYRDCVRINEFVRIEEDAADEDMGAALLYLVMGEMAAATPGGMPEPPEHYYGLALSHLLQAIEHYESAHSGLTSMINLANDFWDRYATEGANEDPTTPPATP